MSSKKQKQKQKQKPASSVPNSVWFIVSFINYLLTELYMNAQVEKLPCFSPNVHVKK